MDGISLFSYFPGTSPLHRFDPRLKMAAVIALSIAVFLADSTGLIILTVLTGALLVLSGYPLLKRKNLRQMRGLLVLAVLIFAGRTFFGGTPAETGAFSLTPAFTQEGLAQGLRGAWRLLLFASARPALYSKHHDYPDAGRYCIGPAAGPLHSGAENSGNDEPQHHIRTANLYNIKGNIGSSPVTGNAEEKSGPSGGSFCLLPTSWSRFSSTATVSALRWHRGLSETPVHGLNLPSHRLILCCLFC